MPPARHFPLALTLTAAILAAALSGCMSMVGLGYGHADTVAAWKADQYFDLDPDQEAAFRARFDTLYSWHRRQQLPEYVVFLSAARQRLERGIAAGDVEWFADGLKQRYRLIVRRGAADAAGLLATLTPAQIENLRERWQGDNRKFAAEHRIDEALEARQRARARRYIAQVRNWAGGLTSEQEERIAALAYALPDTERLRHEDRMRRQREFIRLLDRRNGERTAFTASLAQWLSDWETGRAPEYARLADAAWRQRVALYLAVSRLLTPEQRDHLLHRLENHISEFRRLSR